MASQYNFEAIGTHWQIDIYQELSSEQEIIVTAAIQDRIAIFDQHYSRFRKDSLVTEMSRKKGVFVVPDDMQAMMDLYKKLYMLTGGLVTPLIGQVLVDAGYDASYSLEQQAPLQNPPIWENAIEYVHPTLTIKEPVLLDFGAAGKGYLIDIVAGVLEAQDIHAYCIDAGGDMIHKNDTVIQVGLEHPEHMDQVIGVVTLRNKSLCGSAGNRRKWGTMHHIINPKSLQSPQTILAVWTIADSTMLADGLATCLFFTPPATLSNEFGFEYLIMRDDHSVEKSANFPSELFVV